MKDRVVKFKIRFLLIGACLPGFLLQSALLSFSQTEKDVQSAETPEPSVEVNETTIPPVESSSKPPDVPSKELVGRAWEASSQGDLKKLDFLVNECLTQYESQARRLHAQLNDFPARDKIEEYRVMNDVATILFVQGEALMNFGKTEEAMVVFKKIIDEYKWSQAWDPRGWYWSIAEKSQASINVITGNIPDEEPDKIEERIKTLPNLFTKGKESIINYLRYGNFFEVGTQNYRYEIKDPQGLSAAVGEGIYPNTGSVLKNPGYKKAHEEGRLGGSHWDFVHSDDLEAAFYKWATAPEPWGVKLFYIGMIFEKAKMYLEAIKAYQSIVVHFPQSVGWTYWQTPWYPAQAAIAKIKHIIRSHPELNLKAKWMKVEIKNGFDNNIRNDIVVTYPGVIKKKSVWDHLQDKLPAARSQVQLGKIKKKVGEGKVQLLQYDNGHWQLLVEGKPFLIRGMTYHPTKVGQSPDKGTLVSWMDVDINKNGLADGPYDSWVDKNKNHQQDPDESVVGDFRLMKELGVNTLREYHQPFKLNKDFLRKMHKEYGFYVMLGDYLGKYTLGSGASWFEGTDYENPEHQKNMMEAVKNMVMEFKDEPYILLWILGNENNYGVACNADQKPEAYFKFVNEVAKMMKSIDPHHPIALCNGDTLYLDVFAKYATEIDVYAANVYRGDYGFGSFWEQVSDASGRPAFITEYGSPAYARHLALEEAEEAQANYHRGNWLDIESNAVGQKEGVGNALGGVLFEWVDEWWKNYEPFYHDKKSDAIGPFPGGYYYEEWFGITSQGKGNHSPFLRQLRKSYFTYREMWNKDR